MVRNIIISQYVYNTSVHINRSNSIRLLYCIKNVHVLHAEINMPCYSTATLSFQLQDYNDQHFAEGVEET